MPKYCMHGLNLNIPHIYLNVKLMRSLTCVLTSNPLILDETAVSSKVRAVDWTFWKL